MSFCVEKQNFEQREKRGGDFSCGLCHCTSGSDQGARETCQPGWSTPSRARRAGGARVFMEPLCLPPHAPVSPLSFVSFILFSLPHTSLWQKAHNTKTPTRLSGKWQVSKLKRKFCLSFRLPKCPSVYPSIYLFLHRAAACQGSQGD